MVLCRMRYFYTLLAVVACILRFGLAVNNLGGWGSNSLYALGDRLHTPSVWEADSLSFSAVALTTDHGLAISANGSLYAFGKTNLPYGAPSYEPLFVPPEVLGGAAVAAVAPGIALDVVLTTTNKLYAWGINAVGDGTFNTRLAPTPVDQTGVLNGVVIAQIVNTGGACIARSNVGRLYGWGYNGDSQMGENGVSGSPVVSPMLINGTGYPGGNAIDKLYAGTNYIFAMVNVVGLSIYAWGANDRGQLGLNTSAVSIGYPTPLTIPESINGSQLREVFTGFSQSYLLFGATELWGAGRNDFGQLGDGTFTNRKYFVLIDTSALGTSVIYQVSPGLQFSSLITRDGALYTWGSNRQGQLALKNDILSVTIPTFAALVAPGQTILQLDTGMDCGFIRATSGLPGLNTSLVFGSSQCGWAAAKRPALLPVTDVAFPEATRIFAGKADTSFAVDAAGNMFAWGMNDRGQTLDGTTNLRFEIVNSSMIPPLLGRTITRVAVGSTHTLFLTANGTIIGAGSNGSGELGDNTTIAIVANTTVYQGGAMSGRVITEISAGYVFSMALAGSTGEMFTWGFGGNYALGTGLTTDQKIPFKVPLSGVISIAAGYNHAVALLNNGSIFAWGNGLQNSIGDGATANRPFPTLLSFGSVATGMPVKISAGQYHNIVMLSNGSVLVWGYNGNGQIGDGTLTDCLRPKLLPQTAFNGNKIAQISASHLSTAVVTTNNEVWTFGDNTFGQIGDGTLRTATIPKRVQFGSQFPNSTILEITSGMYHVLVRFAPVIPAPVSPPVPAPTSSGCVPPKPANATCNTTSGVWVVIGDVFVPTGTSFPVPSPVLIEGNFTMQTNSTLEMSFGAVNSTTKVPLLIAGCAQFSGGTIDISGSVVLGSSSSLTLASYGSLCNPDPTNTPKLEFLTPVRTEQPCQNASAALERGPTTLTLILTVDSSSCTVDSTAAGVVQPWMIAVIVVGAAVVVCVAALVGWWLRKQITSREQVRIKHALEMNQM